MIKSSHAFSDMPHTGVGASKTSFPEIPQSAIDTFAFIATEYQSLSTIEVQLENASLELAAAQKKLETATDELQARTHAHKEMKARVDELTATKEFKKKELAIHNNIQTISAHIATGELTFEELTHLQQRIFTLKNEMRVLKGLPAFEAPAAYVAPVVAIEQSAPAMPVETAPVKTALDEPAEVTTAPVSRMPLTPIRAPRPATPNPFTEVPTVPELIPTDELLATAPVPTISSLEITALEALAPLEAPLQLAPPAAELELPPPDISTPETMTTVIESPKMPTGDTAVLIETLPAPVAETIPSPFADIPPSLTSHFEARLASLSSAHPHALQTLITNAFAPTPAPLRAHGTQEKQVHSEAPSTSSKPELRAPLLHTASPDSSSAVSEEAVADAYILEEIVLPTVTTDAPVSVLEIPTSIPQPPTETTPSLESSHDPLWNDVLVYTQSGALSNVLTAPLTLWGTTPLERTSLHAQLVRAFTSFTELPEDQLFTLSGKRPFAQVQSGAKSNGVVERFAREAQTPEAFARYIHNTTPQLSKYFKQPLEKDQAFTSGNARAQLLG
jgi:hypothetical protein